MSDHVCDHVWNLSDVVLDSSPSIMGRYCEKCGLRQTRLCVEELPPGELLCIDELPPSETGGFSGEWADVP